MAVDVQKQIDNPEIQKVAKQYENNPNFNDFKNILDAKCNETTEKGKNEMLAGLQIFWKIKDGDKNTIQLIQQMIKNVNFPIIGMNDKNNLIDFLKTRKPTRIFDKVKEFQDPNKWNKLAWKMQAYFKQKFSFNPTTALAALSPTTENKEVSKNTTQVEKDFMKQKQAIETFQKTKSGADTLTQKYHLEIGETEQNKQLQKLWLSEKEVEDKIKQSPYASSWLKVSDLLHFKAIKNRDNPTIQSDPDFAPDNTRSTQIKYGEATLTMQIQPDSEVKMTDLLNNDSNFQKTSKKTFFEIA